MSDKGHQNDSHSIKPTRNGTDLSSFVFDKDIFSNVFEKDVRRIYLFKKAERLAKAIHLVRPAFKNSSALRERFDRLAIDLVDGAVLPPLESREVLSRELLSLASLLSVARVSGLLSPMNAELLSREAQQLLSEVAAYEEPRLALEEMPTLASLAKTSSTADARESARLRSLARVTYDSTLVGEEDASDKGHTKGQVTDNTSKAMRKDSGRREAILSVLKSKGPSYIKDISMIVRDVSEKTIQRELASLVSEGTVLRKGDRRWTTYELA